MKAKVTHHWHHVIPQHVGGSDDLENLVLITIEEHAEAHRKLFDQARWAELCKEPNGNA